MHPPVRPLLHPAARVLPPQPRLRRTALPHPAMHRRRRLHHLRQLARRPAGLLRRHQARLPAGPLRRPRAHRPAGLPRQPPAHLPTGPPRQVLHRLPRATAARQLRPAVAAPQRLPQLRRLAALAARPISRLRRLAARLRRHLARLPPGASGCLQWCCQVQSHCLHFSETVWALISMCFC